MLGYGIIGSGVIGQEHNRNVAPLDGFEVATVSDPDEAMRKLSVETSEGKPGRLPTIGICCHQVCATPLPIASPNDTHYGIFLDVVVHQPADPGGKAASHHLGPLPRSSGESREAVCARMDPLGVSFHADDAAPAGRD